MKVKSLSCVQLLATPWTAAYQAPPSMRFSRWSLILTEYFTIFNILFLSTMSLEFADNLVIVPFFQRAKHYFLINFIGV